MTIFDDDRYNFPIHDWIMAVCRWRAIRPVDLKIDLPSVEIEVVGGVHSGGGHGGCEFSELDADVVEDEEVKNDKCKHVDEEEDFGE